MASHQRSLQELQALDTAVVSAKKQVLYNDADLLGVANSPAPCMYNLKSEFGKETKKMSYTFGLAREAFKKVFLPHNPPRDPTIPGPGTYREREGIGKSGERYSMRVRTSNLFSINFSFLHQTAQCSRSRNLQNAGHID